jgi:hypothetical protein
MATLALVAFTLPRDPKGVQIVAACNASGNLAVRPQRRDMSRQDHVEWREQSGRAVSWMITPKDPENWPFADTIRGNQAAPASTGLPDPSARDSVPFGYTVTITCRDQSIQTIDPDIMIGN